MKRSVVSPKFQLRHLKKSWNFNGSKEIESFISEFSIECITLHYDQYLLVQLPTYLW